MDLLILAALAIVLGLFLTAMGLSYLSQSLDALEYNNRTDEWGMKNTNDYYNNPLWRINSKWFYYRPKGWVIVSKKRWAEIEKNMGIRISEAVETGVKLGRKAVVIEIQDTVNEEQAKITPSSPYAVLKVEAKTPVVEIGAQHLKLLKLYAPANFKGLDATFVELAQIRREQINKAWNKIRLGVGQKGAV